MVEKRILALVALLALWSGASWAAGPSAELVGRRIEVIEWRGGGAISSSAFERWTGWGSGMTIADSSWVRLSDGVARAGAEAVYGDELR